MCVCVCVCACVYAALKLLFPKKKNAEWVAQLSTLNSYPTQPPCPPLPPLSPPITRSGPAY